ncbi:endosomal cargo receptor [Colletotrichum sojae]|uniref:Endosomal cargo receptor n=1 Tax=Colletotrichum sojae TaxID=2175907 RepID=A0A8H6JQ58_9PEZI|nr:endosomal cargo receptor [Colletotrichum sojae]
MPSGSRQSSKQLPRKPNKPSTEKWWIIRDILQERRRGGKIEYLVDWESDAETGEQYPPTWAPSRDVTSKAIFDWKKKKEARQNRENHKSPEQSSDPKDSEVQKEGASTQGEGASTQGEGAGEQGASADGLPLHLLDSSQSIQPPPGRKRKRSHLESRIDYLDSEAEEDNLSPTKRHCRESLSSFSSRSEVDTDAASEILPEAPSDFYIEIPSKLELDTSEYLSLSNSQGSTSFGSQSVAALEDEADQVILPGSLSQKTISDSQDYSGFDSQDDNLLIAHTRQIKAAHNVKRSAELEISDSQKQSSLGTSLSRTADSPARFLGAPDRSQTVVQQSSPLQTDPPQSFQSSQEDLGPSSPVFFTQDIFIRSQESVVPNSLPTISENQQPTPEPQAPERLRSASQDSAFLAAQAVAQLVQEQDSAPISVPESSIPSHQADDLPRAHSSKSSAAANDHQESQSAGTPIFLTQPAFEFNTSPSQLSSSQQERVAETSIAPEQESSQAVGNYNSSPRELVTISDSQGDSVNTHHAQVVLPLPIVSASQISSGSVIVDEVVPDTVRRRQPPNRRLSFGISRYAPIAFPRAGGTINSLGRVGVKARLNRRGSSQESLYREPITSEDEETGVGTQSDRRSSSPANMSASASGEPLSAVEELLRLQEAALGDHLDEPSLPSPTGDLGHLSGDGVSMMAQDGDATFPSSMENPSIHINSQPPMSNDWQMGGTATSSTDLPPLSSAPADAALEVPANHDQGLRTASMGDIFPSNLLPPEAAEQLPMTISPSDISRSIEPDEGLSVLQPQEEHPLGILPTEDMTTGKSIASSPDVEEQYPSGPAVSMDQNEYLVTLSMPANIRPLYMSTISVYKREIERFNQDYRTGDSLPDQPLVDAIGRLLDQLRDICDLPARLDGSSIDSLSAEDLKKHAMGTNSKHFFVGRFLERLQTSHKKVLIIVRDINIVGYLEAILGTGEMGYSLKGLHELENDEAHSLQIVLLHTEQTMVDDLSDFDIVIGFDRGIMQTDLLKHWAQTNGKKPMLVRLITTYSIEHLDLMMPPNFDDLERKNALLIAMFQSRSLIANDEQGEMIDGLATHFANQVIDPEPNFGWEPEPIPAAVLDLYASSQPMSQMPPTAEELTSRKRKADDGAHEVIKRVRLSPSPGRATGDIDDAVHGRLNPNPSHLQVRTTQDHLDTLTTKVSELEYQLAEKTSLETNLRKHITNLSKRVKSHDKTINVIQERHMEALRERSKYEAERDEAKRNEETAWEKCRLLESKVQALDEELKKKSATLDEALVNAGTVATDVFKQKTEDLNKSLTKIAELEKKLESREGELGYARDVYQTANQTNSELSRENRELKEQVAEFHKQAAGSLVQIQGINASEQVKEMQRQIAETQAICRDREKELARVEKELRTLKNGRRETRQQSVPRSPRLGIMSPRTIRTTGGGSASRGTSPAPNESGGGTPVPGMQLFNSPANGRYSHLRD